MSILGKIPKFLWPDKRSEWEKKQERSCIDAVDKLENYCVTDRGGLSMDPEETRETLLRFAQQNKKTPQVNHRVEVVQAGILMQWYAWRRLDSVSAARYEFLESADGLCTMVAAKRFSSTIACQDGLKGSHPALGNAVQIITRDGLAWRTTLESAIQAHEDESKGTL